VVLLAPLWLQITHLFVADILWITFGSVGSQICVVPRMQLSPEGTLNLAQDVSPQALTYLGCFSLQTSHKIVILSEAPPQIIACTALGGAESKDPDGAYLVNSCSKLFSTTQARN